MLAGLLLCRPAPVGAIAGGLDPTFGAAGKVTTDFSGNVDEARSLAIQADGKIVVAGETFGSGVSADFAIARYETNGSLDSTFGIGGKVTTDFGFFDLAVGVVIQPDGSIVVAGKAVDPVLLLNNFAIARYNSDGSLDASFGVGGKVLTDFGKNDEAEGIALQADGKIVVAGTTADVLMPTDIAVARYNADGSLDATFGTGGRVISDFGGFEQPNAVAIQSDGRLVLTGFAADNANMVFNDFVVIRYNSNGTLDLTFGVNGKAQTDFSGGTDQAHAGVLQPDGRFIAAGVTSGVGGAGFGLARYNTDGTLDSAFGTGGKVVTTFAGPNTFAFGIALQTDGKIVVAGRAGGNNPTLDFAVARYDVNGALDASFGAAGKVTTDFFGAEDQALAVAIQADGGIVLAGLAQKTAVDFDFALARYAGNNVVPNVCLQDDSNGNLLQINAATGDYQFANCQGLVVSGTGTVTTRGCTLTLQHNALDRRVLARIDSCRKAGTASIQLFAPSRTFTIIDRNTANNTCACGAPAP
jgi:uncharacterized delta-60 repeat protein